MKHQRHPMAQRLILRGYGPLAGLVVLLLFLTMLVPSRPMPTVGTYTPTDMPVPLESALADTGLSPEIDPAAVDQTVTTNGAALTGGAPATGAPGTTGPAGTTRTTRQAGAVAAPSGAAAGGPVVSAANDCSGGTLQDGNTAYSPPCLKWNATDNGGVTTRGVTKDEIIVTMRENGESGGDDEDSKLAKEAKERGLTDTEADRIRTRDALLEYFNSKYQTYGRKVKLVTYKGRGSMSKEFGGGGQEEANADALKVGQEIGAFADLSAMSQPYLDALVRQKVVSFGGLHLPTSYYQARAPYAWGQLIDCTTLVSSATDLLTKRFPAGSKAVRAGSAAMRTQDRKYGLLVPDDPVYRGCVDENKGRLKAAGIEIAKEINYALDFSKMQQETPNMVAQMKQAGVTTLILVTDPALPYFMTGAATQQDYWPEWFISGTAYTDVDVVGQFYDQDQWQYASGQSFVADTFQGADSESYRAYKSLRQDEPAITRDQYYFPLLMLFIGIEMAGPNLNPSTFQAGMFSYPPRNGSLGRWSFSPTDYTAIDDAREVYYDRNGISSFNGKAGRYVTVHGGRRFRGNWPSESPVIPIPPPAAP